MEFNTKIYCVTISVGISTGFNSFLGAYYTEEEAKKRIEQHKNEMGYALHHYNINILQIGKNENYTFFEW